MGLRHSIPTRSSLSTINFRPIYNIHWGQCSDKSFSRRRKIYSEISWVSYFDLGYILPFSTRIINQIKGRQQKVKGKQLFGYSNLIQIQLGYRPQRERGAQWAQPNHCDASIKEIFAPSRPCVGARSCENLTYRSHRHTRVSVWYAPFLAITSGLTIALTFRLHARPLK